MGAGLGDVGVVGWVRHRIRPYLARIHACHESIMVLVYII